MSDVDLFPGLGSDCINCKWFARQFWSMVLVLRLEIIFLFQDLKNKKTKFFGGNSITMVDYMIWPWFDRLEMGGVKK